MSRLGLTESALHINLRHKDTHYNENTEREVLPEAINYGSRTDN